MRKIWLLILSLGLIGIGVFFAYKYLFYQVSFRSIVPAVKMPSNDIKQYMPQDSRVGYPLKIPSGYFLDIYASLDGDLPRALAFDPTQTLVASITNRGKVIALPDENKDGKSDKVVTILSGLNKPHGIAFYQDWIYVAETDQVVRYTYSPSIFTASSAQVLFKLPGGGRHFTRTVRIYNDKLYTSVGSSCDVCIESDSQRASILVSDLDGSNLKVFAKGLRNTVFFAFDSQGKMWGTDMGRDNLGDELPPDELNIIEEGKDYGWPYCYGDRIRDSKFKSGEASSFCSSTEQPVYQFPAHVAPLGLAFIESSVLDYGKRGDLVVAYHGSWNSSKKVGYEVERLSVFADSVLDSSNMIFGWLTQNGVLGRPVDLIYDQVGNLYISDDYSGVVYILKKNI